MEQVKSGKKKNDFKDLQRVVMNLKSWLIGIHHHLEHLQGYLDEYCYRFNRSIMKGNIFDNLKVRVVKALPCQITNICSHYNKLKDMEKCILNKKQAILYFL